jgi:hypothetical protein
MLADKLYDLAESYAKYGPVLDAFRKNMLEVRAEHSIDRSVGAFRASFTW